MAWLPRQLGGLATFALATWFVNVIARFVPQPAAALQARSRSGAGATPSITTAAA
jgi:hypothetical protein